ncbi:glutathione S-transferase family protein [Pseudoalteromonas piscicida]|uniref:Glutathione S-transferase n=1 Tax=Pseudoalteromonas piscicida TaxID=43662 RepID=A0A2A5JNV5_PSEO7|nr:glutathione S-transferase family protein [Pseudoalteromonas piscicida]PCK31132.1 glutathione S-transferase [Pseudoalteromonas piscicida]
MYQLFYYPRNASWAPHLVLEHLQLKKELLLVDRKTQQQKSATYLALNPTGRIPTLVDGEQVIFESAAICLHLCEKHPDGLLIPATNTPQRATFYQWLFYLTTTVQPELMVYFYPEKYQLQAQECLTLSQAAQRRLDNMFTLIDKQLSTQTYLVGEQLTVCDYYLFMLAHWASGFTNAPKNYEHLGRFMRHMAQQKVVQRVCEVEQTDLSCYS